MNNRFAQFLSYIFHPGITPTLGLFLLFHADTYLKYAVSNSTKTFLYLIVFLNTYLFPALIVLIMRYRKTISSIQLKQREDRIIPFAIASFFYLLTYLFIKKLTVPAIIIDMFFGLSLSVFTVFFITFKHKISAHMTGISGLIGAFLGFQLIFQANLSSWLVLLVIIWGMLGAARLQLKAHSNTEIVTGSLVGFSAILLPIIAGWG